MIERIAQAIYVTRSSQPPAIGYPLVQGEWEAMDPAIQERYRNEARNALTAMRDENAPNERVITVGVAAFLQHPELVPFEAGAEVIVSEIFTSMIDAALAEQ